MFSRRFPIWQKVVALAPLLLLVVYLPGQLMLRCRIDGLLRSACCCSQADEEVGSGPVLRAQDCCDQLMTGGERPVVDAARAPALDALIAFAAALPAPTLSLELAVPERVARAWPAQGPPRDGPPLVLLKHAFLI